MKMVFRYYSEMLADVSMIFTFIIASLFFFSRDSTYLFVAIVFNSIAVILYIVSRVLNRKLSKEYELL